MPTAIRHEPVPKTEAPSSFHTPPDRPRESLVESWWIFESLALFVSFLSFFAMFTVLVKFNNRPLPRMAFYNHSKHGRGYIIAGVQISTDIASC